MFLQTINEELLLQILGNAAQIGRRKEASLPKTYSAGYLENIIINPARTKRSPQ
jgi:hypothetical protein